MQLDQETSIRYPFRNKLTVSFHDRFWRILPCQAAASNENGVLFKQRTIIATEIGIITNMADEKFFMELLRNTARKPLVNQDDNVSPVKKHGACRFILKIFCGATAQYVHAEVFFQYPAERYTPRIPMFANAKDFQVYGEFKCPWI